ncbi:5'-3' exonuclease PLD3-like isoform X2 [Dromiciops gliroides]|uniref:5'-3' exonuclease PLD3-like isoform X2 n=1 Tax=Dromiciops gliroides TaxID=33562 RepID=UPI001CC7A3BA|nr:5'-3' exonuclease PLD3-like isoform X2 [Dromiciops gliroides]
MKKEQQQQVLERGSPSLQPEGPGLAERGRNPFRSCPDVSPGQEDPRARGTPRSPSLRLRRPEGSEFGDRKLHSTCDHEASDERLFHHPQTSRLLLPTLILLLLGAAAWGFWTSAVPWPRWEGEEEQAAAKESGAACRLVLAESIPEGMSFGPASPQHISTHQAWLNLIDRAQSHVDIAAYNVTLRSRATVSDHPSDWQGQEIFDQLLSLPSRGVGLRLAMNSPQPSEMDADELAKHGAEVTPVELEQLTGGIVHSKFWVVDGRDIYVGSANVDWRALTQIKELGALLYNCSPVAQDLLSIFNTYQALGGPGAVLPSPWPPQFSASSSLQRPIRLQLDGHSADVYLSGSPAALCAPGRTSDLQAILSIISQAREFILVSVMDLMPQCMFCQPKRFWAELDSALRAAACDRRLPIQLLISCWRHSDPDMFIFLEALNILSQPPLSCPLHVKLFVVPVSEDQRQIPYARMNHNKFMVTDQAAYIGTSNWSHDYFLRTTGVGLVIIRPLGAQMLPVQRELRAVFERDWTSPYAQPLSPHPPCAARGRGGVSSFGLRPPGSAGLP